MVAYACNPEIRRLRQRLVNSRTRLGLIADLIPVQTYTARPWRGRGREREKVKVKDEGGVGGRRMGRNYKSKM